VLALIFVSRAGTRRPVTYGDAFELWDGVHLVAEFPLTLLMDILSGHLAGIELTDRVRMNMPAKRKPLTPAESKRREARRLARKKRSA
jgi:hypothetical protein